MNQTCHLAPINLSDCNQLESLVEHRRIFSLKDCELNIFETFHRCDNVHLSYSGLVVSSMMRGRKIMTLAESEEFDFLPGESVILPEGVSMNVNFPDADERHPVQCATLALDWNMVNKNLEFLNMNYPDIEAPFEWKLNFDRYHFLNNKELAASISKLISISMEESVAKDALADLSLKFLLLRIIQTQNLAMIQETALPEHYHLSPVIQYIKDHLAEKISIDKLASESCMSRSAFFHAFKTQLGISPLEYIQRERIQKAKYILADTKVSITEACYQTGFNNLNYFTKLFKRIEGVTPSAYRG